MRFCGAESPDELLNLENPTQKLQDWHDSLEATPGTIRTYVAVIRSFFKRNNIPVHSIDVVRGYVEKDYKAFTKEEIQRLVAYADPRTKAVILFAYHSGARIGSICKLTYGHIRDGLEQELNPLPIHFSAAMTKYNVKYTTFIGAEAIEALKRYLSIRRRGTSKIPPENLMDSSPLFSVYSRAKKRFGRLTPRVALKSLKQAAVKAGITIRPDERLGNHCFRNAFQRNLQQAGVNQFIIEKLIGHKTETTVTGRYSVGLTEEDLKREWMKADWTLKPVVKVHDEKTMKKLQGAYALINQQALEIQLLKARLSQLEYQINTLDTKKFIQYAEQLKKVTQLIKDLKTRRNK